MKQFVLDTNILIESPDAIWGFDDNVVCITQKTLEELDGLKKVPGDTGFNARRAIRNINSLKEVNTIFSVCTCNNQKSLSFFVISACIIHDYNRIFCYNSKERYIVKSCHIFLFLYSSFMLALGDISEQLKSFQKNALQRKKQELERSLTLCSIIEFTAMIIFMVLMCVRTLFNSVSFM